MKNLYVLGPEGTFSYRVANKINRNGDYNIVFTETIPEIGLKLNQEPESSGVLPIENLITGVVGQAQDVLVEQDLKITEETEISISFNLITDLSEPGGIKILYAHPQAFNQCSRFIATHLKAAKPVFAKSNIHASEMFFENRESPCAALVPTPYYEEKKLGEKLNGKSLTVDFGQENRTRFLKIKSGRNGRFDFGKEKTSIYIAMKEDKHSLLFTILREFHVYETNLVLLHSRPNPLRRGAYSFFIDFLNNHRTETCLKSLTQVGIDYRIIGTYDTRN